MTSHAHPSSDEIIEQLRGWIVSHNQVPAHVDLDTDIIESRLIDSLSFVEFLMLLEELRGAQIPHHQVTLERFKTLRSIQQHYLEAR